LNLGIFSTSPFHLVLTLQRRFSCFCMFFTFRDLLDVKQTQSCCHIIIYGNRRPENKKSMGNATRAKIWPTTRAKKLAAWWGPPSTSWVQMLQTSPLRNHLDIKATIKRALMAATLFFKMPLVRTPSVECCSKRSFPHKGDSG
jgi:hypothetical protein